MPVDPLARLAQHPLTVRIHEDTMGQAADDYFAHMRATIRETGQLPPKVADSDADPYPLAVSRRLLRLLMRVDRLREALDLMVRTPGDRFLSRVQLDRTGWIQYHYAAYVVSLTSISDIALVLAAEVFALGLARRHCTPDIVKSNRRVKGSPAKAALEALERVIQRHRESRNLYIHAGQNVDLQGVSGTGSFDHIELLALVQRVRPTSETLEFLREGLHYEVRALRSILTQEIAEATANVEALFDAFLPEYVMQRGQSSGGRD